MISPGAGQYLSLSSGIKCLLFILRAMSYVLPGWLREKRQVFWFGRSLMVLPPISGGSTGVIYSIKCIKSINIINQKLQLWDK